MERHVGTIEKYWAIRLMNFIIGAHQLLFEGLTRELPVYVYILLFVIHCFQIDR